MRGRRSLHSVQTWSSAARRSPGRTIALILTTAMIVTISDTVTLSRPAVAAPAAPAAPATGKPAERPDEAAALTTARVSGVPVKITGLTTETSEFIAQPNGTIEATVYAAPVRLRRGGSWVPVDLNLHRNADGSIAAAAHPEGLKLSGARSATSGALATVGSGTEQISMGWSGKLPEPVLEGTRATYPEVLPGIDLAVEATRTGFEQFVVVKSREAVARVSELSLPLTGKAVASHTRDASGALVLKNKSGRTIATSPTPQMWDARTAADGETPGRRTDVKTVVKKRPARAASVGREAAPGGVDVTLTPDLAWIKDSATTFPVTIDPQIAVGTIFDTYVTDGDTGDRGGANNLQIGLLSGANGKRTRSFVSWDTTALRGKQITAASVSFYNYYSTTCTANSWEIWSTNSFNSDTRWANQPAWLTKEASTTATKGFSTSCNDGWVSIDGKSFFQRAATANSTRGWMGIRATSETATSAYKQFRSRNAADNAQVPHAKVTYNSYATATARTTVPATSCATGSARPFLNTKTPQLRAQMSDAEGASVTAKFEWWTTGGAAAIGSASAGPGASGSWLSAVVPAGAFAEGGTYSWRVQGYDGTVWSPWSAFCEFTVDTTAPATAPAVSSTAYPENQWANSANTPGSFTFASSGVADVAAFEYGLDTNPPNQVVNAAAIGGNATVSVTPTSDGPHVLYVRSRDRAGNQSAVRQYRFFVGAGALTSPKAGDVTADQVEITAVAAASSTGVTYQWRRGEADSWTAIPTADVAQAAGGGAVAWPLTGSGGQFAKLNWNVAKTLNDAEAGPDPLSGPLQVRALFVGGAVSSPVGITFDRNLASAEAQEIGPGSVNLVTGNLTVSDTDVSVDSYGTDLTVARSFNTRRPAETDSAAMFGPGWVSGVVVEEAESAYTQLDVYGSLAQVSLPDGDTVGFAKRTATAFDPEIGMEDLTLTYAAAGDSYTLRDIDGNTTTFTRVNGAPAGRYHPTAVTVPGSNQSSTIAWEKVTVGGVDRVRPTRMLAPVADGVSCTTLTRGCRALTFTYAAATTASGTAEATWGDYQGRVREITFTAWDPDLSTAAMRTVAVARYAYDNNGRLRATWDPRKDYTADGTTRRLWDTYGYDADGILTTIRPAGQEPWQLAFTTVPGDSGKGRLNKVTRSALSAGSATTTVVYDVPVSGTGAPYDLSGEQTARWAQPEPPVRATAVFPATQVPAGNPAAGTLPGSYERATITYLDANARQVNVAAPGGTITATWYDQFGNTARTLTARNRAQALGASTTDNADAEAVLARTLSTLNIYASDGQRLLTTLGPEHDIMLTSGDTVRGRHFTGYAYDEGAPTTGAPFHLVTTQEEKVRYWGTDGTERDADPRITKTQYDWTLRKPTVSIVDPSGLNQRTRTAYDPITGLVTAVTAPGGGSVDTTPSTSRTVYYRATSGSGYAECDLRPEWANLPCRVQPGGQAGSGPELPVTVTTYDMFNQPRTMTEKSSAGTLRTTTTQYDGAARVREVTTTATAALGTTVPSRRNVYEPSTGQLTRTQSVVNGTVTAEVIREFDALGRQTAYTDADGIRSTTTFDLLGRAATSFDGKATRTYSYDEGSERRGLLTSVADDQAGTFTGTYDADGVLSTEQWPNGVVASTEIDEAGNRVGKSYTRQDCGTDCTLYNESVVESVHGQWLQRQSSQSQQRYTYDQAGRMTSVADNVSDQCVGRSYGYDAASNRTTLKEYDSADDGACQSTTSLTTHTWSYDSADRVNTGGYVYDALGRTTTVPASDTANPAGDNLEVGYHVTDLVDTITQNGRTTDYTLDVDGERVRSWTDTSESGTAESRHHYDGDDDRPAWTQETPTSYTRVLSGLADTAAIWDSAADTVDWQLTNLHGDVVATIHGNDAGLSTTNEATEYGILRQSADVGELRYGWLGAHQRAADTPSGIVLMGVRLYNAATGRFLQVDPVSGGSCNRYEYACASPIDNFDLDGKRCWRWARWACRKARGYYNLGRYSARWNWHNGECRRFQCMHGSPHHYRTVRRGYRRYERWYCSRGSRTRAWFGGAGFVAGFSIAGVPIAAHIVAMEYRCAYR